MSSCLVLGSAGFLGLNLVDALVAAGHAPLCGHRSRTNTIPLRRRNVRRVIADTASPESLAAACTDVAVLYHLAGHYPRDARTPEASIARALSELDNVLDAAAKAGVRRVVYVSSTATVAPRADGASATEADRFAAPPGLGAYHDVKWAMEERARAEDRLDVVIACPGACLGPWDLRIGTSGLVIATARGEDPPHPDGWVNLVDARDVARVLVALGTMAAPPPRVLIAHRSVRLHALLGEMADHFHVPRPSPPLSAADAIAFADAEERRVAGSPERARLPREIADLVIHGAVIDAALAARMLAGGFTAFADTLTEFERFAQRMHFLSKEPICRPAPTASSSSPPSPTSSARSARLDTAS